MDLLTMSEVLERTRLSRRTLFRVRERDEFPHPLRIGRVMVWRSTDVDQWLQANPPAPRVHRDP